VVGKGESENCACGAACAPVCAQRGTPVEGLLGVCVYPRTAEGLKVPVCVWELHIYEKM